MDPGGLETWLMHVLRNLDRDRFEFAFLDHSRRSRAYNEEILSLGSQILHCPVSRRPVAYRSCFREILAKHGPFDVVHSHVHHFSGFVLKLAHAAGVKARIAHSHNDTSSVQAQSSLPRKAYFALMKRWIANHATGGLGCSGEAAAALFGRAWRNDSRWKILHYGLDLRPFATRSDRTDIRRAFGWPEDAYVVGHVGRFMPQKNHAFLIKIAEAAARVEPRFRLLLIGEGELRPAVEDQVRQAGLTQQVAFAGLRSDIPSLMKNVMDAFVLPSRYEGLPLVVIEAQAAGLPAVISNTVSKEVDVVPDLIARMDSSASPQEWAQAVLSPRGRVLNRDEALAKLMNSDRNVEHCVRTLESLYEHECRQL
jgi:glycosyltransferase involved in cell wall biosynthesis